MRAAVLTEVNKPLQILDLEQEPPKANEVRVQVKAAGVCMSDWHIMNGDWPMPLPMVLGHEAAGVVVENGPGVTAVKPGDHVIFSFRPHCGRCRYCSSGRTVLCVGHNDTPRWVMHDGTTRVKLNGEPVNQMARIGTFSEFVVCPAEQTIRIREDLPFTHAAIIGCSVATGVGAVIRHARVAAGESVLVIGCGGVGLNVVQGARLGVDAAFDAIGGEATALQALDAVAPGGRAVLVGIPAFAVRAPISPSNMVWAEKTISGTYYGSVRPDVDFPILADLDMDKKLNLDDLISRTYRFEEINEGFRLLVTGAVARGVIVFD